MGLQQLVSFTPISFAWLRYVKLDRLTRSYCVQEEKTVLMFAIEAKFEALCDKLIEQGADINAKDNCVPPLPSIMRASGTWSLTGWRGMGVCRAGTS